MRIVDDRGQMSWLVEHDDGHWSHGYDASGWDASVWILHAMYEHPELPGGLSHDDVRRIELGAGTVERHVVAGVDLDDHLAAEGGVWTGVQSGPTSRPGPEWGRLRWVELAERLRVPFPDQDFPPCQRWFPYESWPTAIAPPGEGSLDWEQYLRLLDHLAQMSEDANETEVFAFVCVLRCRDWSGEGDLLFGKLEELIPLHDSADYRGSPTNVWPVNRGWFVYTDHDLWATKVAGPAELIESLLGDEELETLTLHV
jgi:hypothetical protein